jgi:predicted alpha/beta-hydrolase family hydrolase
MGERPRVEPFVDRTPGAPDVRGTLHYSPTPTGTGAVLTHGAGSSSDNPLLVAIAEAFANAGVLVLRCDLPFRQARRTGPPSPRGAPTDRAGLLRAARAMAALTKGPIVLGGHSYGGRQASILASAEPDVAAALLLLAYPLHPPGRPAEPRTAHFSDLKMPVLFVHGGRDPFGTLSELEHAVRSIPARAVVLSVEHAGHGLHRARHGAPAAALAKRIAAQMLLLLPSA